MENSLRGKYFSTLKVKRAWTGKDPIPKPLLHYSNIPAFHAG
jgi:hypothetical protein